MARHDTVLRYGEFVGLAGPLGVLGTGPTGTTVLVAAVEVWTNFLHLRLLLLPSESDRAERERLNQLEGETDTWAHGGAIFVTDLAVSLGLEARSGDTEYRRTSMGSDSSHPWAASATMEGTFQQAAGISLRLSSDPENQGVAMATKDLLTVDP